VKIISLEAANIKRLKAVQITPQGHMVVIGGNNAQGKTSVLDSITMALGGKGEQCERPLRDGAKTGDIVVDLGDLVVHRHFTADGGTSLKVVGKDGTKKTSPQSILDALVGRITFDPMAFSRMSPKDQLETLKKLVGLDFTELDGQRTRLFDQRTEVGRDGTAVKARRDAMPHHPDVPAEEVSATDLIAQVEAARQHNAKRAELQRQVGAQIHVVTTLRDNAIAIQNGQRLVPGTVQLTKDIGDAQSRHAALTDEVTRLEARLAEIRPLLQPLKDGIAANMKAVEIATDKAVTEENEKALAAAKLQSELSEQLATMRDEPVDVLLAKVSDVDTVNRKVRQNQSRIEAEKVIEAARKQWDELTAAIVEIDKQKHQAMEAVNFPVKGLSFDTSGVLFNGIPFSQASSAEQLRVSVAMGLALNPKLRVVLIRDGSLLDDDSLRLVAEMAAEKDSQVWVERVGKGDEVSVIIEDGAVLAQKTVTP
jgi:hypothetical protein